MLINGNHGDSQGENTDENAVNFSVDIQGDDTNWSIQEQEELFDSSEAEQIPEKVKNIDAAIISIITEARKYKKNESGSSDTDKETRAEIFQHIRDTIKDQIPAGSNEELEQYGNGENVKGGLYAEEPGQKIVLKLNDDTTAGWYRLAISAMNSGTLQEENDFVNKAFLIKVVDKDSGKYLGTISIPASTEAYNTGSVDFQLEEPISKSIEITWEKPKDANLHLNIHGIGLKKIEDSSLPLGAITVNGNALTKFEKIESQNWKQGKGKNIKEKDNEGSETPEKDNSIAMLSGNNLFGHKFKNLTGGIYKVSIKAANYDYGGLTLPEDYENFELDLYSAYYSATAKIPASNEYWEKGEVKMFFPEGDSNLYIIWANDSWDPTNPDKKADANLMIKSITLEKVKLTSSENEPLTGFLLNTKPGNRILIISILAFLSGLFLMMHVVNRKKQV